MPEEKGKRAHRRTFQALITGSKMKHLKKKDGEPLWRTDIQYDLLQAIFNDKQDVFTNSYTHERNNTFAEIYIDAMARSSKCSKILSEKLIGDRAAGISIAMVCLLVNVGRMNTTLNFFPEMKAQLRTYHPIPSLQSHDTADYKQLQDAPRLKSILKGAAEDREEEPTSFEQLAERLSVSGAPPTNPINLVFLMAAYASQVAALMTQSPVTQTDISSQQATTLNSEESSASDGSEFFDLVLDSSKTSRSRARMFLWLVWAYLESDLSPEQLKDNPFGDGVPVPPKLVTLVPGEQENVDTPGEIAFGNQMTLQRLAYLEKTDDSAPSRHNARNAAPLAPSTKGSHPLVTLPKPRTAHQRRVQEEFHRLIAEKRLRRASHRRRRSSAISDEWQVIGAGLDPLSDPPLTSSALPPVLEAKFQEKPTEQNEESTVSSKSKLNNYGERAMSTASTLRRALKVYRA